MLSQKQPSCWRHADVTHVCVCVCVCVSQRLPILEWTVRAADARSRSRRMDRAPACPLYPAEVDRFIFARLHETTRLAALALAGACEEDDANAEVKQESDPAETVREAEGDAGAGRYQRLKVDLFVVLRSFEDLDRHPAAGTCVRNNVNTLRNYILLASATVSIVRIARLYGHRLQLFGRLWVRLPLWLAVLVDINPRPIMVSLYCATWNRELRR